MTRVITKITRQKKNQERYNIFLNEDYAFSVDETILIQFGLTKGKVIEGLELDEIAFDDEIQRAYNRALGFLSYQMRSEYEVRKKLLDLEFGEAVIQEAIQKLNKHGFLNDATYTKALLETKKKTAKKGPRAIRQDMQKKGIDKKLQEEVLETFSEEEQLSIALKLGEKVAFSERRKTPTQVKQKIQDNLMRKGYSFAIIEQVLEQIEFSREDDEWQQMIQVQGDKAWRKYATKYSGYDLHMRVKQTLYQKGFPADIIETFIEEKERENG
ncbi:recombination regulator RecX [Viridibacillus sp. FSL E2-0187]|uniref:recombination regulator RecX n=1 Tax=Viridibacillus sp. FSL E2-0187 TaxID=2921362 RepID=UPI0030FBAFC0